MRKILQLSLFLAFAVGVWGQTSITHGAGAPSAGTCNASKMYGREYMDTTPTPPDLYLCGSAGWQKVNVCHAFDMLHRQPGSDRGNWGNLHAPDRGEWASVLYRQWLERLGGEHRSFDARNISIRAVHGLHGWNSHGDWRQRDFRGRGA